MSTYSPIGVFDSGVGGLSVVQHIRATLPAEDVLYVADSANVPYGEKSPEWIRERSRQIVRYLIDQGAKAIVVACNTATAAAVEQLREEFDLPIVAMEPAVKPAAEATRSGVIGVLATAGTLESERYATLLQRHGSKVRVLERICHHWVEQVESGELEGEAVEQMVRADVIPLLDAGADTLVLGCTHFSYLRPTIEAVVGDKARIIDPAPAVARQLASSLPQGRQATGTTCGNLSIRTSEDVEAQRHKLLALIDEVLDLAFLPNL